MRWSRNGDATLLGDQLAGLIVSGTLYSGAGERAAVLIAFYTKLPISPSSR